MNKQNLSLAHGKRMGLVLYFSDKYSMILLKMYQTNIL